MKAEVLNLKYFLEKANNDVIEEIAYLLTQDPGISQEIEELNFKSVYNELLNIIEL